MNGSRRLRGGTRGRLGLQLGRAGVSPLLRHSPVRPPPDEDGRPESAPKPRADGRHEVYLGNWPHDVHEMEIAALFAKYSICTKGVHLHRKPMYSYAFVELTCGEDVGRAIDLLHGGKVLSHQIVVRRGRQTRGRQRAERPNVEVLDCEVDCEEDNEFPPAEPCQTEMPPLVLPARRPLAVPRPYSDRDEDEDGYEVPRAKRVCPTLGSVDSARLDLTLDSESDLQSGHSSATPVSVLSDRIRRRLHAPMDVVVANFPTGTSEMNLINLFSRFKPINVRVMVNHSSQHPEDFTYAYVTLESRMWADAAVQELDGWLYQGHHLVVEARYSS